MAEANDVDRTDENELKGATGGEDVVDDVIVEQSAVLLRVYIIERASVEYPNMHVSHEDLGGRPQDAYDPQIKEFVGQLLSAADELNINAELQQFFSIMDANCAQDVFMRVARSIFEDGINLGRVMSLFHLAYKLILKALIENKHEVIKAIFSLFLQFIREYISPWIRLQGRWGGVLHIIPRWRTVSCIAAVAFIVAAVYWKRTR